MQLSNFQMKLKISYYNILINTIICKINSWSRHTLLCIRKLQLIVLVFDSVLPLSYVIIDRIYVLCRGFLWTARYPSISWTNICMSNEKGGYGLRYLKAWNKVLLSKVLRHIQNKQDGFITHIWNMQTYGLGKWSILTQHWLKSFCISKMRYWVKKD